MPNVRNEKAHSIVCGACDFIMSWGQHCDECGGSGFKTTRIVSITKAAALLGGLSDMRVHDLITDGVLNSYCEEGLDDSQWVTEESVYTALDNKELLKPPGMNFL